MSEGDSLSKLQWRILSVLSEMDPEWTLTGGAALAGFHLKHRRTKDVDLFWREVEQLGELPVTVKDRLEAAGFEAAVLQTSPTFHRLRVRDDQGEVCLVDLVAEPASPLEAPMRFEAGGRPINVDSPHEILVGKLCALLSRSELRDLQDIEGLLEKGGDLVRALCDAPKKDAGFSPLTLAWVLRGFNPGIAAKALRLSDRDSEALVDFHGRLIDRVLTNSKPE